MGPLRSRLLAAVLAVATTLLCPAAALACDCSPVPPGAAFARSDVVVFATFVRLGRRLPSGATEYLARVDRAWKGAREGDSLSIWTDGGNCGLPPWHETRVFFLRRDEGRLTAHLCDLPDWGRAMTLPEVARALDALATEGRR